MLPAFAPETRKWERKSEEKGYRKCIPAILKENADMHGCFDADAPREQAKFRVERCAIAQARPYRRTFQTAAPWGGSAEESDSVASSPVHSSLAP